MTSWSLSINAVNFKAISCKVANKQALCRHEIEKALNSPNFILFINDIGIR